nr:CRISPR-associated ring nuclease Csm6 [uncultured Undibacterium sp.]
MSTPEQFKRRILLCVTGMSPQVITETLYALSQREQPFIPTEIHVITTQIGKRIAALNLFQPAEKFAQLRYDYNLPDIDFTEDNIHVIKDRNGEVLSDIRSPDDNEAAADSICKLVASLTKEEDVALHVSIAGGRKSMGFYMGYALSLYGRPQDRLSHVLVSDDYEGNPKFYFPARRPAMDTFEDRVGRTLDAHDATVTLADIPFVRMRLGIPPMLETGEHTFGQSVRFVESALFSPLLEIVYEEGIIRCAGRLIKMPPRETAFYIWLAQRRVQFNGSGQDYVDYETTEHESFLKIYQDFSNAAFADKMVSKLNTGFSLKFFEELKSLVNKALRDSMGRLSHPYEITLENPGSRSVDAGANPAGLTLDPGQIQFSRYPLNFLKSRVDA